MKEETVEEVINDIFNYRFGPAARMILDYYYDYMIPIWRKLHFDAITRKSYAPYRSVLGSLKISTHRIYSAIDIRFSGIENKYDMENYRIVRDGRLERYLNSMVWNIKVLEEEINKKNIK